MKGKRLEKRKKENLTFIKYFIPAFTFVSGSSVMIVEITASRLLAPLYGNTLFTWSALIGVLLLALAIGYFLGGWIIDKKSSLTTLLITGIIGGVSVLTIIPIFNWLESWFLTLSIKEGPIISSVVLFALPSLLLGMITPMGIKLLSAVFNKVGISAGTISMVSTIGSVLGTFLAGYLLIPFININYLFVITGVFILLPSLIGLIFVGEYNITISVIVILGFILRLISTLPKNLPQEVLYEKYNFYHRIRVEQKKIGNSEVRILKLDTTYEGAIYKDTLEPFFEYTKYYKLYKIFVPELKTALFIGGGGYAMPIALEKELPQTRISVVELDPEVEEVGRIFFGLNNFKDIKTVVADGRRYLYSSQEKFDLIFSDAYSGPRAIPPHLITKEFFELVSQRLTPQGVFMLNLISPVAGKNSLLFSSVVKTLKTVFREVFVFKVDPTIPQQLPQNLIIVSLLQKIDPLVFEERLKGVSEDVRAQFLTMIDLDKYKEELAQGKIFTDRYNPVEYIALSIE